MKYRVLVELDCLVDTVLGTVASLNPSWVQPLLKAGYTDRVHNQLKRLHPSVDTAMFEKAYAERDVNVLMHSRMTMIPLHIREIYATNYSLPDGHPEKYDLTLTVNYYPYKLNKAEIAEYQDVLRTIIPHLDSVKFISIDYDALTPYYVQSNFEHIYVYHLTDWMIRHTAALDGRLMEGVTVTSPIVVIEQILPTEQEIEDMKVEIAKVFIPLFEMELIDLSIMSYCDPDRMLSNARVGKKDGDT